MAKKENPIVVCSTNGCWEDDVQGHCAECNTEISWRPHNPEPSKKICVECFHKLPKTEMKIEVTDTTIQELAAMVGVSEDRARTLAQAIVNNIKGH